MLQFCARMCSMGRFNVTLLCVRNINVSYRFCTRLIYLPPSKYEDRFLKNSYQLFTNDQSYKDMIVSFDISVFPRSASNTNVDKLENRLKRLVLSKNSVSQQYLQNLNKECAKEAVTGASISETLKLLSVWHILCGLEAFYGEFFRAASNIWERDLQLANKKQLLLMLFFLSQTKNASEKKVLNVLSQMEGKIYSLNEWALICHCCFKCKVKIPPVIMNSVCSLMKEDCDKLDGYLVLSFVKAVRLSNYYNEKYFEALESFVKKNFDQLNFVECSHILAAYANERFYDQQLYNLLEKRVRDILIDQYENPIFDDATNIQNLHGIIYTRSKDLARYLWSMHHVSHSCSNETYEIVNKSLLRMVKNGSFKSEPNRLVDSLQSLALQGRYLPELLEVALSETSINSCFRLRKSKPLHQLHFLANSATIECPTFLRKQILPEEMLENLSGNLNRDIMKDVQNRTGFVEILNLLKREFQLTENHYFCSSPLPHIPIAGILLHVEKGKMTKFPLNFAMPMRDFTITNKLEKIRSIEILDETSCVRKTSEPLGLLATKIRQLRKLDIKVICLNKEDVQLCLKHPNVLVEKL